MSAGAPAQREPATQRDLLDQHGGILLQLAIASIRRGLRLGRPLQVNPVEFPQVLQAQTASFVTLRRDGQLRGCVGSAHPHRPLVQDVAANGFAAAFADERFAALSPHEAVGLVISVSVLSNPEPLNVGTEAALVGRLRPFCDGLIIEGCGCRALFLPQVWEHYADPAAFVLALKTKAGLPREGWSDRFRVWRFTSESVCGEADRIEARWS